MVNSGIESTIFNIAIRTADFDWTVSLITTQKNEILSLGADGADIQGATSGLEVANVTRVGESLGSLYPVQTVGVNPANGQRIFHGRDIKDEVSTYTQVQYNHVAPAASRWTLVSDGTPTSAVSFDLGFMFQFLGEGHRVPDLQRLLRPRPAKSNVTAIVPTSPAYLWPYLRVNCW